MKKIYFIGINGIGMSGLAKIMKTKGYEVNGADLNRGYVTEELENMGITVYNTHEGEHVKGCDMVIASSAIKHDNPEYKYAVDNGIKIVKRGELLAMLLNDETGIAVAGTHGKTTTSSMMSSVMLDLDPTIVVGGILPEIGSNAKPGKSEYFVAEADESDNSFLFMKPSYAVITNVEEDHLDTHGCLENINKSFSQFIDQTKNEVVVCIDCENLKKLIKKKEKDAVARKYLEMVELPGDFADRYPHNMSGGQRQRVGIARAIALEPEIIFCDESTSALDVSIQKAILELLVKLQKEKNIAIGFICHDLAMISSIAHQIAVMYMGNIVEILPGEEVARGALHPYTKALLQSVFDLHMDFNKPITPLEGEASMPTGELQGCPFQNRCAFCMEKCQKEKPELKTLDENHQIACWRI